MLKQLILSMDDGVIAVDSRGQLIHYNPAVLSFLGLSGEDHTLYTKDTLLSDPVLSNAFNDVLSNGKAYTISEYTTPTQKTLSITLSPVFQDTGDIAGAMGLFRDITAIRRIEHTQREYIANISHELKAPLTSMRGLLEPLTDGMIKDEATVSRYHGIILREVDRLNRLITDMRTLTKLQQSDTKLDMSVIDVQALIEDVVLSFQSQARFSGIDILSIHSETDVSPLAVFNEDALKQILIIFIDNAIKHAKPGAKIRLYVQRSESFRPTYNHLINSNPLIDPYNIPCEKLVISVSDTGEGIPDDSINHVFERFYKAPGSIGTGLGLAIVKTLGEKYNETAIIESEFGQGTVSSFTVGLASEPAPEQ